MAVSPGPPDPASSAVPAVRPGVPPSSDELAVVVRSGFVESRHVGHAAIVGPDGGLSGAVGDPDAQFFPRSSLKPLQAAAMLLAGAPLSGERLAMATSSHQGEPRHVAAVTAMLADAGLSPEHLGCPPALPGSDRARMDLLHDGGGPSRLAMNCSGKHAGMLTACVAAGWDVATYLDPEHPLQVLARRVVEQATGVPVTHVGVDGCGAPLFTTTPRGLATAMGRVGRLAATARPDDSTPLVRATSVEEVGTDDLDAALGRVGRAMRTHPWAIAGEGGDDTVAMRELEGVVSKGGAEAVLALGTADGDGVAVKVLDGSARAAMVAGLSLLATTGIDTAACADTVAPRVLGGGRPVGGVQASPTLGQVAHARRA
jgi:L-asparaginase II